MKKYNSFIIGQEHEGLTIEEYLKKVLNYSGRKIQKLTRIKGILLNNKTVYLQRKVKGKDRISIIELEDFTYGVQPESGEIQVLYEDANVIVLNKPANQLVHPTQRTLNGTIANYLANYFQKKGEIVTIRPLHRLDRDTTGCIVFAKDSLSQSILEEQLKEGILKRKYLALVKGIIEQKSGIIDVPIGPHPTLPNRRTINLNGDRAITHFNMIQTFADSSLLEVSLETGRTHQIRLHLAYIGHPIIGDRMYGKSSTIIQRQALHASSIYFLHPKNKQENIVEAPLPIDFLKAVKILEETTFKLK